MVTALESFRFPDVFSISFRFVGNHPIGPAVAFLYWSNCILSLKRTIFLRCRRKLTKATFFPRSAQKYSVLLIFSEYREFCGRTLVLKLLLKFVGVFFASKILRFLCVKIDQKSARMTDL